jgi:DNA (cytosine-5)-methyltransferase 1
VASYLHKPRLLDLFCGAGGAAMGYHRAGFEVVGVDIKPQPRYPFEFFQADALELMRAFLDLGPWPNNEIVDSLEIIDAIHASPPCQGYSDLRSRHKEREYPDLIAPTRELCEQTGLPFVIENVRGARLRASLMLCGSSFNLGSGERLLRRHRYFEINWDLGILVPPCNHLGREAIGVYGGGPSEISKGYQGLIHEKREAMGIEWMVGDEIAEAIPPAYTEFIGEQLMAHVKAQ